MAIDSLTARPYLEAIRPVSTRNDPAQLRRGRIANGKVSVRDSQRYSPIVGLTMSMPRRMEGALPKR